MSRTLPADRNELMAARDKVRRQLEVLRTPSAVQGGKPENGSLIADLEVVLRDLEEGLAAFDG